MRILPIVAATAALTLSASPQERHELPAPFRWEQDLATATRLSNESGRPVIAYFTFET